MAKNVKIKCTRNYRRFNSKRISNKRVNGQL